VKIGLLGLGEAGARLARDLEAKGVEVRGYDPRVTPQGSPEDAVADADVVLSLVTAAAARAAVDAAAPALRRDALYADLNTAAPALKRELAGRVERFVDVALLGAVPARGIETPALASGPGAAAFAGLFTPLGMRVDVVSATPGDAAALKLLRSVFMKGVAAAAVESMEAAEAAGHAEWLHGQLAEVIGEPLLERFLTGSRAHAARRAEEMDAAGALLRELGVEPRVARAAAELLASLDERRVGGNG
jgi:3-hydroxyisobutyrate dehydrogenase-like beta-hydroxyacid dehydrogenase